MELTHNNLKIDVQQLKCKLLSRRITPRAFDKWPLTEEQTADSLTAAVMAETEYRHCGYKASAALNAYIRQAARWLCGKDWHFGLLLCGLPGNGKSTLMRGIVSLTNFLSMKDTYGEELKPAVVGAREVARLNKDDYKSFKKLCGRPFVCIDDLGLEPAEVMDYGNVLSPAVDLLTTRYDGQLPTVVTTNLTGKEIRARYGDRIADRFNEMMSVIIFENDTYRGKEQRI